MSQIIICYLESDSQLAVRVDEMLQNAGYRTTRYEHATHKNPAPKFIQSITKDISDAEAVVLFISPAAMNSPALEAELTLSFERQKHIIPLLIGITHEQFKKMKPNWAMMIGPLVTIPVDPATESTLFPQIVEGLRTADVLAKGEKGRQPPAAKKTKAAPQISFAGTISNRRKVLFSATSVFAVIALTAALAIFVLDWSPFSTSTVSEEQTTIPTITPDCLADVVARGKISVDDAPCILNIASFLPEGCSCVEDNNSQNLAADIILDSEVSPIQAYKCEEPYQCIQAHLSVNCNSNQRDLVTKLLADESTIRELLNSLLINHADIPGSLRSEPLRLTNLDIKYPELGDFSVSAYCETGNSTTIGSSIFIFYRNEIQVVISSDYSGVRTVELMALAEEIDRRLSYLTGNISQQ